MPNRANHSFRCLSLHKLTSLWRLPEYQLKPHLGKPNPSLFLPFFSLSFFIFYYLFWILDTGMSREPNKSTFKLIYARYHFWDCVERSSVVLTPLTWSINRVKSMGQSKKVKGVSITLHRALCLVPYSKKCSKRYFSFWQVPHKTFFKTTVTEYVFSS